MKKIIILIVFSLILLAGVIYFLKSSKPVAENIIPENKVSGVEITYVNSEDGQQLKVVYDNEINTATIYPNDINEVVFTATTSASGAQYENSEKGLVLWNKGNDVSLYLNNSLIFSGTVVLPESIEVPDSIATTTLPSPAILDGSWIWKETVLQNGQKITPKNEKAFVLNFKQDGNISGTTDCNGFGGSYQISGADISFGTFMSTLMYCEDSQESDFTNRLSKATSYSIENNNILKIIINNGDYLILEKK